MSYDRDTVDHVIGELTDALDYCDDVYNPKVRRDCRQAVQTAIDTHNTILKGVRP